jgi:multicomponent Na+:H+ antiporter subunit E
MGSKICTELRRLEHVMGVIAQISANLIVALMWVFLLTPFSVTNIFVGWLLGLVVVYFWRRRASSYFYPRKLWEIIVLTFVFLREVTKSAFLVMRHVFTPGTIKIQPVLIAYETGLTTPLGIILLSNMITITPGSFVVEISPDNKVLLIHVFHAPEPELFERDVRVYFEANIKKVLGRA